MLPPRFIDSNFATKAEFEASLRLPAAERAVAELTAAERQQPAVAASAAQRSHVLQYDGNNFDGAVLPGRPAPPADLDLTGAEAMRLAVQTDATPSAQRDSCDVLLFISSAAGYERRRKVVRSTYLSQLGSKQVGQRVRYRFLLGAPKPDQVEALAAEQAEYGDLLQVGVPESYETLFPKVVAAWRWAVSTHDFAFWMHADDDSYVRLDLLLEWLGSPAATPNRGLYAGYIWDGSEGRRTRPLRDPTAKSYMPVEQWPHDSYPPFASGCGFLIAYDLVESLVERSPSFTFFRVIDVPIGIVLSQLPTGRLRIVHMPEVRPYRPLPLFRAETIVQHYMQPEEFRQFHERALTVSSAAAAAKVDDAAREQRIADVYDMFVAAKVMRR